MPMAMGIAYRLECGTIAIGRHGIGIAGYGRCSVLKTSSVLTLYLGQFTRY